MEKEENIQEASSLDSYIAKRNRNKKIIILSVLIIVLIILISVFLVYLFTRGTEIEIGDNIEGVSLSENGQAITIKLDKDLNLSEIEKVKFLFINSLGEEYLFELSEASYKYRISAESARLENFKDIKEIYIVFTYTNGSISEIPSGTTSTGTGTTTPSGGTSGGGGSGGGGGGGNGGGNGGCTPKTCADYEGQCGSSLSNGCGGSLDCSGNCGDRTYCYAGEGVSDYCVNNSITCIDSDNGLNYYSKGNITINNVINDSIVSFFEEDFCNINLTEYYCYYNGTSFEAGNESYECESGCWGGECQNFKETTYSLTMPSELGKIIDLNNDGLLDVIVLGEKAGGTKDAEGFVNLFYQNQDGQLILSENTYSIEHGADMINAGDVNNDGLIDIVITTDDVSANVTAFLIQKPLNNFSLSFEPAPGKPTSAGCGEIGDINGDGLNDVLRGNKPRGSVSIYYQNESNELQEPVEIFVNANSIINRTSDARIADFNNDGKNDFAVRNGVLLNGNAFFTVFYNIGDNKFNITNYDTGVTSNTGISDIRIGDFNNDGLTDLVVSIQKGVLGVYLQKNGDLEKNLYSSGINEIRGLGVGDLNNDGKDDVVASAFNCQTGISILLQEEGNFSRPFRLSSSTGFGGMVEVGDVNNDGENEIVTTNGLKLQTSNCPETYISVIEVNKDVLFVEETTEIPPQLTSFNVTQSGDDLSVYVFATDNSGIEKINLNSPITDEYLCNGEITCEHVFNVNLLGSLSSSSIMGNVINKFENKCGDGVCDTKEQAKPDICPKDCVDNNQINLQKDCMYQCVKVNEGTLVECGKRCNVTPPVILKQKEKKILKYQGINVSSKKDIEIKDDKIIMQTKLGSKEIKIMPDTAQNAALKKRTMKEINIELKESSGKPIYELKGKRKAKLFGFIPVDKKVTTEVDADTAEIVSTSESWWSFLATDAENVNDEYTGKLNESGLPLLSDSSGEEVIVSVSVTNMNGQTTTRTKNCPEECEIQELGIGTATLSPTEVIAGSQQTFTVIYTTQTLINTGGQIKIYFANNFFQPDKPLQVYGMQSTNEAAPGYTNISTTSTSANLILTTVLFGGPSPGWTRLGEATINVTSGSLEPGDNITITLVYGAGQEKAYAQEIAHNAEVTVRVSLGAGQEFNEIQNSPILTIISEAPYKLISAINPDTDELKLSVVDIYANLVDDYSGLADIHLIDENNNEIDIGDINIAQGKAIFQIPAQPNGYYIIKTTTGAFESKVPFTPGKKIYFGDLHFHTRFSDTYVSIDPLDSYEYGRYTALLDFLAVSDHVEAIVINGLFTQFLTRDIPDSWQETKNININFNSEGNFVTFLGYETTHSGTAYPRDGHVNVYFKGYEGETYSSFRNTTELWQSLYEDGYKGGDDAMTIQHHSLYDDMGSDFFYYNSTYAKLVEIYSHHGNSECMTCEDLVNRTDKNGAVQRALSLGQKFGFVGCSDNHFGHPSGTGITDGKGKKSGGLTAVVSPSLTKNSLWNSMINKSTYATSGERIYLEFNVNNAQMGSEISATSSPVITARVIGTNNIQNISIIKYDSSGWRIVYSIEPNALFTNFSYTDTKFNETSIYYLRIKQAGNEQVPFYQAWSSPIWVNKE